MDPVLPFIQLGKLIAYDAVFGAVLSLLVIPLCMSKRAAFAVLKRNFIGYFSNPTGYVFLCIFVLLTSLAAFWPPDFFKVNMANLDQLNRYLPLIMIVFIPAITMSIWAEERRQGTDELLLTLPADDFEIVIGKYLAAAAIFTVSLVFSQLSNFVVLAFLSQGDLDTGLFFTTYLGYWFIGLGMLAIGMVASFLTNNLTVSFVLGVAFNAPLAFLQFAKTPFGDSIWAQRIASWSTAAQFDNFGRGVISTASMSFFILMATLGVYLSMVLIGARHWFGGRDGKPMVGHYLIRILCLGVLVFGVTYLFRNHDLLRYDATQNKASSLSDSTRQLISNLKVDRPVVIDAYVSEHVPEKYSKTKYDLINLCKEFNALSNGKVTVHLFDGLSTTSEQLKTAEKRFGIKPRQLDDSSEGSIKRVDAILGAAFSSGANRKVVPFFDFGVPVEYEMVRSITIVAEQAAKRRRLGVVTTDAQMMGGFTFAGMQPQQIPKQLIVEELEKQYDVEQVDPTQPIKVGAFDVLLVVQPSSLGPQQMDNLVTAIKAGQPAVICEDPLPLMFRGCPGTQFPKQAPGGMFGQGGPPPPKGDIRKLWNALGLTVEGNVDGGPPQSSIVWQHYNPMQQIQAVLDAKRFVHIRDEQPRSAQVKSFNRDDVATKYTEYLLFLTPGGVRTNENPKFEYTELVATGDQNAGAMDAQTFQELEEADPRVTRKAWTPSLSKYALAMRVQGKEDIIDTSPSKKDDEGEDEDKKEEGDKKDEAKGAANQPRRVNVAYIGDIDFLESQWVYLRGQPKQSLGGVNVDLNFDNVDFLLTLIDEIAGETRFAEVRSRRLRHSTLRAIADLRNAADRRKEDAVKSAEAALAEKFKEAEEKRDAAVAEVQQALKEFERKRRSGEEVDQQEFVEKIQLAQIEQAQAERELEVFKEKQQQEFKETVQRLERQAAEQVEKRQSLYRYFSVLIPPIPPILLGVIVFLVRRLREREGISRARRL
jgi:ABC-2 type transport system permease protein